MLALRLQLHQIHDVDDTDLQRRAMLAEADRRQPESPASARPRSKPSRHLVPRHDHCSPTPKFPVPAVQCLTASSIVNH